MAASTMKMSISMVNNAFSKRKPHVCESKKMNAIVRNKTFVPIGVSLLFAVFFSYIFAPGLMSVDSISQYKQTIGLQHVNDYFPVVMVRLWQILFPVTGASSILVFDQILYWLSVCIISIFIFRSALARTSSVILLGLWPPLLIISLHVWKDAGMLVTFLLASGAIIANERQPRFFWASIAVISLFYAVTVRYNAFTGAVPLVFYIAWQLFRRYSHSCAKKISFCLSGVFLFLLVSYGILRVVNIGATTVNPWSNIVTWDMAAISIKTNKDYIPKYMTHGQSPRTLIKEMKDAFNPVANIPVFSVIKGQPPEGKKYDLLKRWAFVVSRNPFVYLRHRWTVFARLIDISGPVYYPFNPGIEKNNLNLSLWNMPKSWNWIAIFNFLSSMVLYKPWVYLVGSLFVFVDASVFAFRNRTECGKSGAIIAFSSSAIGMVLPLFFVAPAADFRYTIWLIGAFMICILILFSKFGKKMPPSYPNFTGRLRRIIERVSRTGSASRL